jgi:hypothetical protein
MTFLRHNPGRALALLADDHMPVASHRTQREVREDEDRKPILRGLGK